MVATTSHDSNVAWVRTFYEWSPVTVPRCHLIDVFLSIFLSFSREPEENCHDIVILPPKHLAHTLPPWRTNKTSISSAPSIPPSTPSPVPPLHLLHTLRAPSSINPSAAKNVDNQPPQLSSFVSRSSMSLHDSEHGQRHFQCWAKKKKKARKKKEEWL